jgi:hypothetical protein
MPLKVHQSTLQSLTAGFCCRTAPASACRARELLLRRAGTFVFAHDFSFRNVSESRKTLIRDWIMGLILLIVVLVILFGGGGGYWGYSRGYYGGGGHGLIWLLVLIVVLVVLFGHHGATI